MSGKARRRYCISNESLFVVTAGAKGKVGAENMAAPPVGRRWRHMVHCVSQAFENLPFSLSTVNKSYLNACDNTNIQWQKKSTNLCSNGRFCDRVRGVKKYEK